MSVIEQLTAYRAKKVAEKEQQDSQSIFRRTLSIFKPKMKTKITLENNEETNLLIQHAAHTTETFEAQPEVRVEHPRPAQAQLVNSGRFCITTARALKLLLWLILFALFVELEFGSVFFVVSLFYLVYTSMESGSRDKAQPSAYSVFNPRCERLQGTFTAEQFESELRYGALNIH